MPFSRGSPLTTAYVKVLGSGGRGSTKDIVHVDFFMVLPLAAHSSSLETVPRLLFGRSSHRPSAHLIQVMCLLSG